MKIKIEVSARHIHLSEDDFVKLFGHNEKLSVASKLSQEDDFATDKTVKISTPKNCYENVRVVGSKPFRTSTQVEISKTDAIFLGLDAPLKISGDLPGSIVKIIGPNGTIEKDCAIIAKRHLHLPPEKSEELNLRNNDMIKLKVLGERGLEFDQIVVRVKSGYTPVVHLDTDEANACNINKTSEGELILI